MELVVSPAGDVHYLYDESIDLASLGPMSIRRASHVEPDEQGRWFADLSVSHGPLLGPFARRSDALQAEAVWLSAHRLNSAS
ncbi:MAG: hypothetical protein JNM18_08035 [Planctomycetaceae bacterium]|nr:hypothetical protein [Planctomycetaceae bacterium]